MAYSSDKAQQQINSYAEFVESFRQTTAKRMAEFEQELADAQKKAHEAAKKKRELPARASVAAEIGRRYARGARVEKYGESYGKSDLKRRSG
ncbi:hypothetical protein CIP101434_00697 [Corynebacterium diphtheriae]|nr:hypothetical protein CIP101280_00407 [Corynebacterium diphtheriae]CAB0498600.1 hypothetical protein CIP101434_00697 [Corynebacterium diphtheriae]